MNMARKRWIVALLSFILPGAGLVYLGKWSWGLLNLAVAVAILALGMLAGGDLFVAYIHYPALAVAAGSAGLAHAVAQRVGK